MAEKSDPTKPLVELVPPEKPTQIDTANRDGFEDARSCANWAISHTPTLQSRIKEWLQSDPYALFVDSDPERGDKFLAAYQVKPLDPFIYADIGAMLNSIRSALDMLMCALCRRNGIEPTRDTKFPIHRQVDGLRGELKNIEKEKWLTKGQVDKIEALRPHKGGDDAIFAIHTLDVVRKHDRFLSAQPSIVRTHITAWGGAISELRPLNDKTILYRLPATSVFRPTKGNAMVSAEIFINEPTSGVVDKPAVRELRYFARRVLEIIDDLENA
jgi:hypothetical protein